MARYTERYEKSAERSGYQYRPKIPTHEIVLGALDTMFTGEWNMLDEQNRRRNQLEAHYLSEPERGKVLDSAPLEAELKRRQKK